MSRNVFALLTTLLSISLYAVTSSLPRSLDPGDVRPIANMREARAVHTSTLLSTGEVLITGGMERNGVFLSSAELYDPRGRGFTAVGPMKHRRTGGNATLLPDGRVLVTGGLSGRYQESGQWKGRAESSAEIYDPATRAFVETGRMREARTDHAGILLSNGKVLIAGGSDGDRFLASAELYDPPTGAFTPTGSLTTARLPHAVALLKDGRVLVAGGTGNRRNALASAEIYDPATSRFSVIGSMTRPRHKHAAATLNDGRVLIVGGSDERDWNGQTSTAELYDPAAGRFTATGSMKAARFKIEATLVTLGDGRVLVGGGGAQLEIYDPAAGSFALVRGRVDGPRYFAAATRLNDGSVLVTGGYGGGGGGGPLSTAGAWRYEPTARRD